MDSKMVMVILLILGHIAAYIVAFQMFEKFEKYKYAISSILITYSLVYVSFIEFKLKDLIEIKWLKLYVIIGCYLLSLLLFLIIVRLLKGQKN